MKRRIVQWGLVILFMVFLTSCGGATPTSTFTVPEATSVSAPVQPTVVQSEATEIPPTEEPATEPAAPAAEGTDQARTPDGTVTVTVTSTQANPLDLPFLMRIDRISVVVGRGTLFEGRVAHGTLSSNGSVEILGPQGQVMDASVLAILLSGIVRDQVTVGDYAGILVEVVDTALLSPGLLLSEAGAYESYEDALLVLQ